MALAPKNWCYFSSPQRLKASVNLELGRLEIVVVCGRNVASKPFVVLQPNAPILMLQADAEALIRSSGVGFLDDRQRPDTPEAEVVRRALAEDRRRFRTVLFHPAVFRKPEQERWATDLLTHTDKSAWEICRILTGFRPVLVATA
jgi:hypothetical protein